MAIRNFLKLQHRMRSFIDSNVNHNNFQKRRFSKKIIEKKLLEIRSKNKFTQFEKENYLQRYNLTPSKLFIEKHPILLNDRSVSDIKNLLYLLDKRCGFNDKIFNKIYNKYPSVIELTPQQIIKCLNKFKILGFNNYESFLRLEPSILFNCDDDNLYLNRLNLYLEILEEIGIDRNKNGCKLLEKYCVHIIQREPKYVISTLKYYEQIGINIYNLILLHPQSMIYTKNHIKKVINFIHFEISDINGIDIKIIESCPSILGINLDKLKKVIIWLNACDLLQITQILQQAPHLLIAKDVSKLDETYKCLINNHAISRNKIKDNSMVVIVEKQY